MKEFLEMLNTLGIHLDEAAPLEIQLSFFFSTFVHDFIKCYKYLYLFIINLYCQS